MLFKYIAGVDEAGRGPLAGPVVAAAVILPAEHNIIGLADSKKLSPKKREELSEIIQQEALSFAIAFVERDVIDEINILQASLQAMSQAVAKLTIIPDKVLVDGNITPDVGKLAVEAIVKGDTKIAEISAASILAKVARDKKMLEYDVKYPVYGFARHKGYGTKQHMQALATHGACPLHRTSFAPVRKVISI
jgi:ribonuclease HII